MYFLSQNIITLPLLSLQQTVPTSVHYTVPPSVYQILLNYPILAEVTAPLRIIIIGKTNFLSFLLMFVHLELYPYCLF